MIVAGGVVRGRARETGLASGEYEAVAVFAVSLGIGRSSATFCAVIVPIVRIAAANKDNFFMVKMF